MTIRVQVLPLTPTTVGAHTHTPFVLVIDGDVGEMDPVFFEGLKQGTGAIAVLASREPIIVVDPLLLTDEQANEITSRILGEQRTE